MIGYHTPETKHEDYYALNILSSILSSGKSSRLYTSLVDEKTLQVFTDYGDSFDPNLFNVYVQPIKNVNEAV
jgi:predicted Zn-dependent peptidase